MTEVGTTTILPGNFHMMLYGAHGTFTNWNDSNSVEHSTAPAGYYRFVGIWERALSKREKSLVKAAYG